MTKEHKSGDVKVGKRSAAPKKPSVELPTSLSVRELADLFHISAIEVIKQLMRNGMMANIKQVIGYEVAATIAADSVYKVRQKPRTTKKSAGAMGAIKRQLLKDK